MIPKFEDVLKRVESGEGIKVACIALGCKRTTPFYKSLTIAQKLILKRAKLSNGAYLASTNKTGQYTYELDRNELITLAELD